MERTLIVIRALIAARDFPKKKLARKCRISKSKLSQILHGDQDLSPDICDKIFGALGVSKERQIELLEDGDVN